MNKVLIILKYPDYFIVKSTCNKNLGCYGKIFKKFYICLVFTFVNNIDDKNIENRLYIQFLFVSDCSVTL